MSELTETIIKNRSYKCLVEGCNASFNKNSRLEVHSRKHTAERPFRCDIPGCTSSYTNTSHLRRHKCLVHEKSGEVICQEKGCGQVFGNKYNLKKHINNKHNTAKNVFNCSECSLSFKRKQQLHQHVLVHTKDVPFKCSICNIGFTQLHLYNKHNRNHKSYTCDCGNVFDRWTQFCEHRRVSCTVKKIEHKCVICDKVFTTGTNLRQHAFTHVQESQLDVHRCPYINCTRSYKYKKNLSSHIATSHEKSKPQIYLKCTEPGCEQVLKSKKNLRQHLSNIHSGFANKNKNKKRNPRRDKGLPKKCMASIMSGIELPLQEHLDVIAGSTVHKNSSEESGGLQQTSIEKDSFESHHDQINQATNVDVVGENNSSSSNMDHNIINCTDAPIKYTSESKCKKETSKSEESCNVSIHLENSRVSDIEQNLCSPDDALLNYCDDVLKALEDNLDKIPNMTSNLV